jgi:bifunctional ADP-heptose synthase (sugar kinase/adenylyltransferase)
LRNLKGVRCLLIGETIIDRYVYVKALGKPTKGSHIAADILSEESHAGGILAAANHLAGFCERVDVLTCIGSDGKDMGLRELLKGNVRPTFFLRDGDTIVKTRYTERFSYQKMFQTYQGMTQPLHENDEHRLREVLSLLFANGKYDLVLVIDYGHGFISDECAEFISQHAPWLALSVQTNTANFGHNVVTKYSRARYVCVDEPEIRLAFRSQWGNPEELALKLLQQPDHEYESIILTRGHHGCVIPNPTFPSCNIPAFSTQVVDAVGAGDAFIALTSPCMKKGMPIELAGFIGNAIGALAVGTVGNRSSVEPMTLFNFINTLLK